MTPDVAPDCEIVQFLHCRKCLESKPPNVAPREYGRLEVGWTTRGLALWCVRHDMVVFCLDFKGQKIAYCEDDLHRKGKVRA